MVPRRENFLSNFCSSIVFSNDPGHPERDFWRSLYTHARWVGWDKRATILLVDLQSPQRICYFALCLQENGVRDHPPCKPMRSTCLIHAWVFRINEQETPIPMPYKCCNILRVKKKWSNNSVNISNDFDIIYVMPSWFHLYFVESFSSGMRTARLCRYGW